MCLHFRASHRAEDDGSCARQITCKVLQLLLKSTSWHVLRDKIAFFHCHFKITSKNSLWIISTRIVLDLCRRRSGQRRVDVIAKAVLEPLTRKQNQKQKIGQRTKRSVYSVTMHVHARAGAAHLTLHVAHVTHARCVAILAKAASALFFFLREPPFSLASQNGRGGRKNMATGARTGGEPSGAHWDHRAAAWDTAGGPGRYTNTGHGAAVCKQRQVSASFWRMFVGQVPLVQTSHEEGSLREFLNRSGTSSCHRLSSKFFGRGFQAEDESCRVQRCGFLTFLCRRRSSSW